MGIATFQPFEGRPPAEKARPSADSASSKPRVWTFQQRTVSFRSGLLAPVCHPPTTQSGAAVYLYRKDPPRGLLPSQLAKSWLDSQTEGRRGTGRRTMRSAALRGEPTHANNLSPT